MKPIIQDVSYYPYEMYIIRRLNMMLMKPARAVTEIKFLSYFRKTTPYDPQSIQNLSKISPKSIINYIREKHAYNIFKLHQRPDLLETFVYTYRDETGHHEFTVSNNMSFYDDVLIMCYLHESTDRIWHNDCDVIRILIHLMKGKYKISINSNMNCGTPSILCKVAFSFPSIRFELYNNHFPHFYMYAFESELQHFHLPIVVFSPASYYFFPKLSDPPIAVLLAIYLKVVSSKDVHRSAYPEISLLTVYEKICELYNSTIFPENLKLCLCVQWNVVVMERNGFKYAPCFMQNYQKAKELIITLRRHDPHLNYVLSMI